MKPLCIYHGNCADGFGAAWVVRRKYGDEVEFHAGKHQTPPPDVRGRDVIMVDFSYKRPVLLDMAENARTILILDHHKSAAEDLAGLPGNVQAMFDMERCGAMMTWDYFFPGEKPYWLLQYIQDRDLWQFKLPHTREFQAALFSYEYDFEVWDRFLDIPAQQLIEEGAAIERKHFKDINELLKTGTMRRKIGGYMVPVTNLPYIYSSDAGHILCKGEPFAACYWDNNDGRNYSLRSSDSGLDVSKIAAEYGGGGHRNAAGFKIDFSAAEELGL